MGGGAKTIIELESEPKFNINYIKVYYIKVYKPKFINLYKII